MHLGWLAGKLEEALIPVRLAHLKQHAACMVCLKWSRGVEGAVHLPRANVTDIICGLDRATTLRLWYIKGPSVGGGRIAKPQTNTPESCAVLLLLLMCCASPSNQETTF